MQARVLTAGRLYLSTKYDFGRTVTLLLISCIANVRDQGNDAASERVTHIGRLPTVTTVSPAKAPTV